MRADVSGQCDDDRVRANPPKETGGVAGVARKAPDVRDQKEKEFTTKQQAFQNRVAQRQAEIQAGFNKAARVVEIALEPILKTLMTERGANMVEYGLLLALIAVIAIVAVRALGDTVSTKFSNVNSSLN